MIDLLFEEDSCYFRFGQLTKNMSRKKLKLSKMEVSSFVTSLDQKIQDTLLGGHDLSDKTRILSCPSNQDPVACGRTRTDDCNGLLTDNPAECSEVLN